MWFVVVNSFASVRNVPNHRTNLEDVRDSTKNMLSYIWNVSDVWLLCGHLQAVELTFSQYQKVCIVTKFLQ
jgi:hypothetical protein